MAGRRFKSDFNLPLDEVVPYVAVDDKGRVILSPNSTLVSTEAVVSSGQALALTSGGTGAVTLTIVNNVITGVAYVA